MQISMKNFGAFLEQKHYELASKAMPNGQGKTTLVNAYIYVLTGKTINGFVPINVNTPEGEQTSVTLSGFLNLLPLRRTTTGNGTILYVGEDVTTQEDFKSALQNIGYDLDFIITCANANILTSTSLDTATLRKVLSNAKVLNSDEYDIIKKEQTLVRKKITIAEQHALTNLVVPLSSCQALTEAESRFVKMFRTAKNLVNEGVVHSCQLCKRRYTDKTVNELTAIFNAAKQAVQTGIKEFSRIIKKSTEYELELQRIIGAKRLVELAKDARKDVILYKTELQALTEKISVIDASSVKSHLPKDVNIITEIVQKSGNVKPICTIEYKGIPLRSINRAKRIELCVAILDHARNEKAMNDIPIIIDNAEGVEHPFPGYKNIIRLYVG